MKKILKAEIAEILKTYPIWSYLAKSDVKTRFRRTKLGLAWPVLQQLLFSIGAGLIWAAVFKVKVAEFVPFLTLGFAIWAFISASFVEGCCAFVNAHGYLKQLPLSPLIFIYRTVLSQLFYFLIGLATALSILLFFGKLSFIGLILSIPGLLILLLFSLSIVSCFAYLGLRYRDLPHGISGVLSVLFVITPVIYPSEILLKKGISFAVYANPFASLLEVVRQPLLSSSLAEPFHYIFSLSFILVFTLLSLRLRKSWLRFIPFWS